MKGNVRYRHPYHKSGKPCAMRMVGACSIGPRQCSGCSSIKW